MRHRKDMMYILFYVNKYKGKIKEKDNLCPIYCRITINKQRREFSIGYNVLPSHWKKQRVLSKYYMSEQINLKMKEITADLHSIHNSLDMEEITAERIRNEYCAINNRTIKMREIAQSYLATQKKRTTFTKNPLSKSSYNTYRNMVYKFLSWLESVGQKNLEAENINVLFMDRYRSHLMSHHSHNFSVKCMAKIKELFAFAEKEELIEQNNLSHWEIPKRKFDEVAYLTDDELQRIEKLKCSTSKVLEKVRDLFVFQAYTGLGYDDMYNVDHSCFRVENGDCWLEMKRGKTDQLAVIPFLPKAKVIWDKYEGKLPKISNQSYNMYLKNIGELIGSKNDITTHMARRTFATSMNNKGVSTEVVALCLGHSNTRTTERYYLRLNHSRVLREFKENGIM